MSMSIHARIRNVARSDVFAPAAGIVQDAMISQLQPTQPLQATPQFASLVRHDIVAMPLGHIFI